MRAPNGHSIPVGPDAKLQAHSSVTTKTKCTYNLSPEMVATVKELLEKHHVASSQDALVEQAIQEPARRIRDVDEARLWALASRDEEFESESEALADLFAEDDRDAWTTYVEFRRSVGLSWSLN